jgi:Family of unknown function (DUF5519)
MGAGERIAAAVTAGDALVDLPFPCKVRDELVATGRARPQHVLPETGWVRLAYDRAVAARARAEV